MITDTEPSLEKLQARLSQLDARIVHLGPDGLSNQLMSERDATAAAIWRIKHPKPAARRQGSPA